MAEITGIVNAAYLGVGVCALYGYTLLLTDAILPYGIGIRLLFDTRRWQCHYLVYRVMVLNGDQLAFVRQKFVFPRRLNLVSIGLLLRQRSFDWVNFVVERHKYR